MCKFPSKSERVGDKIKQIVPHRHGMTHLTSWVILTAYELKFGFRAKHSTTHALIKITDSIKKAIDDNNFSFGVL